MKEKVFRGFAIFLALVLCVVFGTVLTLYARPMEDISLDLSLQADEGTFEVDLENYDLKGWIVYTAQGDAVTELEPNGLGGFRGLELGQTFYFSRVMEEELDSPTLQIDIVNQNISVWLDDTLIYTDCPELDNRIGYLTLPMKEWENQNKLVISLPADYLGKTLTIAQSFPEYTEGSSVMAYPANVMLYCGYAYESELISESFGTAILSAAAFALGVILLITAIRNRDWGVMALAMVAFLWMTTQIINASFFLQYFDVDTNSPLAAIPLVSAWALLLFLYTRAGKGQKLLLCPLTAYALSLVCYIGLMVCQPVTSASSGVMPYLICRLPEWLALLNLVIVLIFSTLYWRYESWFWQVFTPVAYVLLVLYWVAIICFIEPGMVGKQILISLQSGHAAYIYLRTVPAFIIAAVATTIADVMKKEIARRTEKRLLEEHQKLALVSYENMRCQHEEVMKLRHDMNKHFQALQKMTSEETIKEYLDDLIDQDSEIRPVVQVENRILEIILNSKIHSAVNSGIKVDIIRTEAPDELPLSNADLCSLVMNILDNAIAAAAASRLEQPNIQIDLHVKGNFLSFLCVNSADIQQMEKAPKNESLPKHGFGLRIIQSIVERYEGLIDLEYGKDYYKIWVAIPLVQ